MVSKHTKETFLFLLLFLVFQLAGQLAAGFAGNAGGLLNLFTPISYIFFICRGLLWVVILKRVELVSAYPFTGLAYLLILPLSALVFGDEISWEKGAGAVLIFIGIMFTAAGQGMRQNKRRAG